MGSLFGRGRVRTNMAAAVSLLVACATETFHSVPVSESDISRGEGHTVSNEAPAGTALVGLALSGGGNRSALFASYVLELLGSVAVDAPGAGEPLTSFLNTVRYVSSVSGGGFASAYLGLRNPCGSAAQNNGSIVPCRFGTAQRDHNDPRGFNAMLMPDEHGALPAPYADYFANFHIAMNYDWRDAALFGAGSSMFGWTASRRLEAALDEQILKKQTFADLYARERDGLSPYLIFNTTHFDTGRRFVMTTLPRGAFCLNVNALINGVLASLEPAAGTAIDACDPNDPLTPEAFDAVGYSSNFTIVRDDVRISTAVTMSGAFPGVVGPVAVKVIEQPGYLHLVDGGVTDNSGVESLAQVLMRRLLQDPKGKALIVELDAGMPFDATDSKLADVSLPLSALAANPSRLSDIQEVRALLYRRDLWNLAQAKLEDPAVQFARRKTTALAGTVTPADIISRVTIVTLRPDDLQLDALDLDGKAGDSTCHWTNAKQLAAAVRSIPTDYLLQPCMVELTRVAACYSVALHAAKIQAFFARSSEPASPAVLLARLDYLCPELRGKWPEPRTMRAAFQEQL